MEREPIGDLRREIAQFGIAVVAGMAMILLHPSALVAYLGAVITVAAVLLFSWRTRMKRRPPAAHAEKVQEGRRQRRDGKAETPGRPGTKT